MKYKERIFAPGPTPVPESSRLSLSKRNPYHRTDTFSEVIGDVTDRLQEILKVDWPVVPVSASGTGAMQMAVNNVAVPNEKVLVIESGKFGERWSRLLRDRGADVISYEVTWGEVADPSQLRDLLDSHPNIEAVYGTLVETSTLVRHPVKQLGNVIGDDALFVVDAIGGLAAEPFEPEPSGVDLLVAGSQKGLMGPPGLSFVAARNRIIKRAREQPRWGTYFDLPLAVDTLQARQQTPWTPPMNLLRSLRESLRLLQKEGLRRVIDRHRQLARICRTAVEEIGLEIFPEEPSSVGTAVRLPDSVDPETLRDEIHQVYGVYFPGGQKQLEGRIIRIGHLGHVDFFDLLSALSALELGLYREGCLEKTGAMVKAAQEAYTRMETSKT